MKGTMKLITLGHREDFGHDWYVQLLHHRRWALLQVSVSYNEFTSWPYIQVRSGGGSLFDVQMWVWKLGLSVDFCGRLWSYDLLDRALDDVGLDDE